MCESLLLRMFVAVAFVLMIAPANSETITISSSIPFASNSGATAEQKTECALDTRLPKYIEAAAGHGVEIVISAEPLDEAAGKILRLEIIRANDLRRGLYLRPSKVAVRGELLENGETIGSFVAMRQTHKSFKFDGFKKGVCARFGRSLYTLSRDIAKWLVYPTKDAKLGDV